MDVHGLRFDPVGDDAQFAFAGRRRRGHLEPGPEAPRSPAATAKVEKWEVRQYATVCPDRSRTRG